MEIRFQPSCPARRMGLVGGVAVDAAERDLTPAALDALRVLASSAASPPGLRSESAS